MRKGTKRKATAASTSTTTTTGEQQQQQNKEHTKVARATKRLKVSKPESEPEFFDEQRELEDLWKQAFPVGTEWHQLDALYKYKWNFSNLEDAFEEGGVLNGKKVYLFRLTEPQLLTFNDRTKITGIPVVIAVASPFPPSDMVGTGSIQGASQEIVNMKHMKMDWVPYIPLGKRDSSVERLKSQIFILSCVQRRAGLKDLKLVRVKEFEYCLPYFHDPFKEDETMRITSVDIEYPMEPKPVLCKFDWDYYDLEGFTDDLITDKDLPEDHKDAFKEFVKEKVREGKRANREAKEMRKIAREAMGEEKKAIFENIEFYKFYPDATPDTPKTIKGPFINRYYGNAHYVI